MRASSRCVALDCAPLTPSIKGSITSVTLSGAPERLALEKRSLAAFRSAASNGMGVGGGGGAAAVGAGCAGPPLWAWAAGAEKLQATTQRNNPREALVVFIDVTSEMKGHTLIGTDRKMNHDLFHFSV